MKSYWMLGMKYIRQNCQRTIVTVLGVTVTVMLLFAGLNLAYSYLLHERESERSRQDYEFVLFAETEEVIEGILADSRVRTAYIGNYYDWSNQREKRLYENAIYINTNNPYRMNKIFAELTDTYGISGEYNRYLASLYLQGYDGSYAPVVILSVLLVCYIFAVFGVSIVRTSLQLSMIENICDYANLRCIGSSKKQLQYIVFIQGLILEGIGIVAGSVLGTLVCLIITAVLKREQIVDMNAGFHPLPFLILMFVFLSDLYFLRGENVKLVTEMSPVEAIRGKYKLPVSKRVKHRAGWFSFLFQKLFGIEGEYALKNVMRNPRRFRQTIAVVIFGMTIFMMLASIVRSVMKWNRDQIAEYKYFQLYAVNKYDETKTLEMAQAGLPSVDILAELSKLNGITDVRQVYAAESYLSSAEVLHQQMTEEFLNTTTGNRWKTAYEDLTNDNPDRKYTFLREVGCYGYDQRELERYQSVLVEGTLDVSPQGVILVNQIRTENTYTDIATGLENREPVQVPYTNYRVGETIELLDIAELHRRIDDSLKQLDAELHRKVNDMEDPESGISGTERTLLVSEYYKDRRSIIRECERQLEEEGCYKTYTIEGIVSEDVNLTQNFYGERLRVLMPLENYFELTGTNKAQPTGIMYHVEKSAVYLNQLEQMMMRLEEEAYVRFRVKVDGVEQMLIITDCEISSYIDCLTTMAAVRNWLSGTLILVLFILTVCALNIINTTASNLYLRRNEFAQIRAIGVTKRGIIRMAVLEGVAEVLIADGIAILAGTAVSYGGYRLLDLLVLEHVKFYFPYGMVLLGIAGSILLLCGSIYITIKRQGNDLASDLITTE